MENNKMSPNRKKWILAIAAIIVLALVISVVVLMPQNNDKTENATGDNELITADGELFDYDKTGTVKVGEYKGIEVSVEPDEEDVNLELSSVLDDIKILPEDKVIKKGDYAYIDYTGSINGIELEELQAEEELLVIGEYKYVKAFEDALVGKEAGETYTVPIAFANDYPDSTVAGQEVVFQVTIKAKFDNLYAEKVSKGKYKDVASYKQSLAKRLRKENMENVTELAWNAFIEKCEVNKYPKKFVDEEIDNLNMQYAGFAEISGTTYEELMESLMMDDESVKETAQDIVRDRMLAKTIAKWENIVPDDDTSRKYLIQLMEYEEDDKESLEDLLENYREDYGSRPKDDILVAAVKDLISGKAVIK